MSQTAIPLEFERYLQNQISVGKGPEMNEMIFAYVPGLDPSQPIDRTQGLPDVGLWVHQQDIDQVGKLGDNILVYSVVIPGDEPEFTFNAIYLRDKNVPNSCGIVVHKAEETKENGMASTKSLAQQYDGAAHIAGITVDAATWQIDYQARLKGIEEDHRLACFDNYGHTAFVDGFDVTQQADPNKYKVMPGVVYVGGLRGLLTGEVLQTVTTKPNGLYVDVVRQGTALSVWENNVTIAVSETELTDYVDGNGAQHYVAKLAGVNADGTVVDWRVKGGLAEHIEETDPHNQYSLWSQLVGLIVPDSLSMGSRERAFLADGAEYNRADYPKLWGMVKNDQILVSQDLIDANPEQYAANYGDGDGTMTFTVPNYTLRPHLTVAGVFGAVGSTIEDRIQNITGTIGQIRSQSSASVVEYTSTSGVFALISTTRNVPLSLNAHSEVPNAGVGVSFDASKVVRTGSNTEVNSSFLNFYIIHGEVA